MDAVRFWIGLILVMSYPVALLLWVVIHPFAAFWRRLGAAWTYGILSIPSLLLGFIFTPSTDTQVIFKRET